MADTGSHDPMSNLLHGSGNGVAFPSTLGSSYGQVSLPGGSSSNDDGRVVGTSSIFSLARDDEISDDESSSVGSWMSDSDRYGGARFLAPEIEEIPSPRFFPFSPARKFEQDTVNLEEVVVDDEVLDGILEHMLQAAGQNRLWLSKIDIRQLCAACGDSVVEPDIRSFAKASEKLWKALFVKLSDLEQQIKEDTSDFPKLDAGVEGLTHHVLDRLWFAFRSWKKLLEAQHKHTSTDTHGHRIPSAESYEEMTQRFRKDLMNIADLLVEELKSKSELYKDKSHGYIFLMNNWNVIALWAPNKLPKNWCSNLFRGIDQLYHLYLREAWGELVTWLKGAQLQRPPSEKAARERIDSFNKKFEKALRSQRSLVVSSEGGLRANLKLLILGQLLQPYRLFVDRYLEVEKRSKYLKYTPEDIEIAIDGLFGGSDEPSVVEDGRAISGWKDDTDVLGTRTRFSTLLFKGIAATGLQSSNSKTVLNDTRVDHKNEDDNSSGPNSVYTIPSDTIILPSVDETVGVSGSSTRTDHQWSECRAAFVSEQSVPPSNPQTTDADLGGLELQDSEDLAEPVNNNCPRQVDDIIPPFSSPLDLAPTSLISAEMQESSLIEGQRRFLMTSPDTLRRSSFKRTPHKVGAQECVLVRHDGETSGATAASQAPNRLYHNCPRNELEQGSLPIRLHEQVARGAADGDDRSLRYTNPKDWTCDDEVDVTYWEENAEANLARYWQNTLSACILGSPPHSHLPDLTALQQRLQVMWEPMGAIRLIRRRRGFFLVSFANKEDTMRALEEGPWLLDGKLLVLKLLSRDRPLDEDRLTSIPIWVRILGVPVELWDREHLGKFGSRLGFPVRMDATTAAISNAEYARICVEVPLDFSFPSAITILSSTGRRDRLLLQYEWRGEACKVCNLLGHEDTVCGEHSALQKDVSILPSSSDVRGANDDEEQQPHTSSSLVNSSAQVEGESS